MRHSLSLQATTALNVPTPHQTSVVAKRALCDSLLLQLLNGWDVPLCTGAEQQGAADHEQLPSFDGARGQHSPALACRHGNKGEQVRCVGEGVQVR